MRGLISMVFVGVVLASSAAAAADMIFKAPVAAGNCDPYAKYSCWTPISATIS
jgi:hypothetical protein